MLKYLWSLRQSFPNVFVVIIWRRVKCLRPVGGFVLFHLSLTSQVFSVFQVCAVIRFQWAASTEIGCSSTKVGSSNTSEEQLCVGRWTCKAIPCCLNSKPPLGQHSVLTCSVRWPCLSFAEIQSFRSCLCLCSAHTWWADPAGPETEGHNHQEGSPGAWAWRLHRQLACQSHGRNPKHPSCFNFWKQKSWEDVGALWTSNKGLRSCQQSLINKETTWNRWQRCAACRQWALLFLAWAAISWSNAYISSGTWSPEVESFPIFIFWSFSMIGEDLFRHLTQSLIAHRKDEGFVVVLCVSLASKALLILRWRFFSLLFLSSFDRSVTHLSAPEVVVQYKISYSRARGFDFSFYLLTLEESKEWMLQEQSRVGCILKAI